MSLKVCGEISQEKEESWWLVIGGPKSALVWDSIHRPQLLAVKSVPICQSSDSQKQGSKFREPLLTLLMDVLYMYSQHCNFCHIKLLAQVAIKRITISKASANVKLEVELGEEPGSSEYTLYLMSDSYQAIVGREEGMGKFRSVFPDVFPKLQNCFSVFFEAKTYNLQRRDAMCEVREAHCQGCDQEYNFKLNVKAAP